MAAKQDNQPVDEHPVKVTSVLPKGNGHAVVDDSSNLDEKTLAELGYKSEFKRYSSFHYRSPGPTTDDLAEISAY